MLFNAETYNPPESIGFLLSRAKNAMGVFVDAELQRRQLDLTGAQWVMLMRIAHGCGRTAADLCRDNGYDTGSMTRMLDRLEEKGFIHRERSTEDRRVVQLALTDAGEALVPALREIGAAALNCHLRDFSQEEVDVLKGLLQRIVANGSRQE
ncbi:MAG: MarR family transcriptional regulator [Rhodocyclaceae bacterium]